VARVVNNVAAGLAAWRPRFLPVARGLSRILLPAHGRPRAAGFTAAIICPAVAALPAWLRAPHPDPNLGYRFAKNIQF